MERRWSTLSQRRRAPTNDLRVKLTELTQGNSCRRRASDSEKVGNEIAARVVT